MPFWGHCLLLVLLHSLDEWTTQRGLLLGAREANPLARWLVADRRRSLASKGLGVGVIIAACAMLWSQRRLLAGWLLWGQHVFMALVVLNNAWVIREKVKGEG